MLQYWLCFATSSTELQDDRLPIVLKMHLEFKFPPVDPVPLGDEYQDLNYTGRYGKVGFTKGQLISKYPFGVFKLTKKPTKVLQGFLP